MHTYKQMYMHSDIYRGLTSKGTHLWLLC